MLKGLDGIDVVFLAVGWIAIIICAAFILLVHYKRLMVLRILLAIVCAGLLVLCYFYFQPQLQMYFTASVMALTSLFGFYKTFSK